MMRSATLEEGLGAEAEETYEECDERRSAVVAKLKSIELAAQMESFELPEKIETHRDVLLKEMAWMATDFQTERKRHSALRKKKSKAVLQYFKQLQGKRQRQDKDHEIAMKRLAAKVSKLVKTFWFKIDKVIHYKQRLEWQAQQRKAMDRHLVHLVRQTEKYTGDLANKLAGESQKKSTSAVAVRKKNKRKTRKAAAAEDDDAAARLDLLDAQARDDTAVPRPYLLDSKLSLRQYQHVGLNWLASMHARRLNGILADEMGLGKTVQAISLLAHLACTRGIWGPHLVVAPTSVLVNWESEFKKFCPGLKIVTYYGSAKARKQLRTGWTKAGALHVCVTSYQLAVQDASVFRRKKFYYLILDEAHNIKNFESRRWRTLLAFQAQRRLLLTGTPLQNSLMELWSLMHFLMPHLFRSRQEFSYWFSNPLSSAVEGRSKLSEELVKRLHSIMRPFVLRRLKKDVAKQLPGKFEHEIQCKLSRRQQLLYEEFMSRSSTRKALQKNSEKNANFVSMMNVVMQLRKVCNHPDLFEPRPVVAPFVFRPALSLELPTVAMVPLSRAPNVLHIVSSSRRLATASLDLVLGPSLFVDDVSAPNEYDRRRIELDAKATETLTSLHAYRRTRCGDHTPALSLDTVAAVTKLLESHPTRLASRAVANHKSVDDHDRMMSNRARRLAPLWLVQMLENSSLRRRVETMQPVLSRFVFVVPAVVAREASLFVRGLALSENSEPTTFSRTFSSGDEQECLRPIELAQSVNFPDRSLVQWDSGKFHQLAPLLRDLKRDKHRCLIFTQMSKMLDVLEAFLSFHGHTYSRLDGSTAPDARQRRVERFNTDESLFCMILSTRSGGLGINLTGADVVIFYDSDWNPAMDAQATDRAHRIGQTREVHIYRLVCAGTVEENILVKAKQKRKLEFVALTEGQFDAAGIVSQLDAADVADLAVQVEDAEDVEASKKAQREEATEAAEFSEETAVAAAADEDAAVDETEKLEAEFAAWQERVGPDPEKLAEALKPVERKCLEMRDAALAEYYAPAAAAAAATTANGSSGNGHHHLMTPSERKLWDEMKNGQNNEEFDVDAVEEEKVAEEHKACIEGDILVSDVYFDNSVAGTYEQAFKQRRRKMHGDAARRRSTGAAWERRHDVNTGEPFWYNVDTEEATWRTPTVIARRDAEIDARIGGYGKLALDVTIRILACVSHLDRARAATLSRRWARAARDECFVTDVLPVERLDEIQQQQQTRRRKRRRRDDDGPPLPEDLVLAPTRSSLRSAIESSSPGETLYLGAGHYWEDAEDLVVSRSVRVVGDLDEPARVVVELGGAIKWLASSGTLAGVTLRRPRASQAANSAIVVKGKLCASHVAIDNEGAGGSAVVVDGFAFLGNCRISGASKGSAVLVTQGSAAALDRCSLVDNETGLSVESGAASFVVDSWLGPNQEESVVALAKATVALEHCDTANSPPKLDSSAFLCSKNTLGVPDTLPRLLSYPQDDDDEEAPKKPTKRSRGEDGMHDETPLNKIIKTE